MEKESQQPGAGMLGCDREVFSRIWARASTHDQSTSPIEVLSPVSPRTPMPSPAKNHSPMPHPPVVDVPGSDRHHPGDVPCFGRNGMDHSGFLQMRIREELEGWRAYQFLSSRAGGSTAAALASMAADERRHAQRLSGAYFLISGIRFFPQVPPHRPNGSGFWSRMREAFWGEQADAAAYAAAAAETADPCLAALYREIAAEETAHADLLRALTEKMPTN